MRYLLLLTTFLFGCQTYVIRHDKNMSSIKANYHAIETKCNGKVNVGDNGCLFSESIKTVQLHVRSIQSGSISVVSEVCKIDWKTDYSDSEYIKVPLDEIIENEPEGSCLLSIIVSPVYEDQEEYPIRVDSFKGDVLLKKITSGIPAVMYSARDIRYGIQMVQLPISDVSVLPSIMMDLSDTEAGFYNVIGCSKSYMGIYPDEETPMLSQIDFQVPCVYHGAVIPLDGPMETLFSLMVNVYSNTFEKLSEPMMFNKKKNLVLLFEPEVSFIELNGKLINQTQAEIKNYDLSKTYHVRAYTVRGRYIYGFHENGIWEWRD